MRNGTDPLLIDLASRECINVECRCGRVVQLAAYQLIGRNLAFSRGIRSISTQHAHVTRC